ncbi:MAG: hypothetical protein E7317_00725 [Clostridiales bacterium]|nr:hypothetical protein [Clostridiales bacterium]
MKKITSILMVLMLLFTGCAFADSAVVIADPVIIIDTGEQSTIDLSGLEVDVVIGSVNDATAIRLDILGGEESLFGVTANLVDDKAVFAIDGIDGVYCAAMPENMQMDNLTESFDFESFNIDFEAIDAEALMGIIANGVQIEENSIYVPYTTVNELIAAVAPAFENATIPNFDASELLEAAAQLKDSDSGISLLAQYEQTEDSLTGSAYVLPVSEGTEGDPVVTLNGQYSEDLISFALDVPDQINVYANLEKADENGMMCTLGGSLNGLGAGQLSGYVAMTEVDAEIPALDASAAIDVESLDEETAEALNEQFQNALGGVLNYVSNALMAEEAVEEEAE